MNTTTRTAALQRQRAARIRCNGCPSPSGCAGCKVAAHRLPAEPAQPIIDATAGAAA